MKPEHEALAVKLTNERHLMQGDGFGELLETGKLAAQAITDLSAERDALAAEVERLREALTPFAQMGDLIDGYIAVAPSKTPSKFGEDFRKARAALNHAAEGN